MKYFSSGDPVIVSAMNQVIKNKENKILEELQKIKQLKKVKVEKLSRPQAKMILR